MRTTHIVTTTALALGLAAGGFTLIPALAQDHKTEARVEAKARLSIAEVRQQIAALGYENVDRIERESSGYEVRARTRSGERVKLYVDASSGDIVHTRSDFADGAARTERRGAEARGAAEDCSKRRCRDDRAQVRVSKTVGWYLSEIYDRMKSAGI